MSKLLSKICLTKEILTDDHRTQKIFTDDHEQDEIHIDKNKCIQIKNIGKKLVINLAKNKFSIRGFREIYISSIVNEALRTNSNFF